MLLSSGRLSGFVSCYGQTRRDGDQLMIDAEAAAMLDLEPGDRVLAIAR